MDTSSPANQPEKKSEKKPIAAAQPIPPQAAPSAKAPSASTSAAPRKPSKEKSKAPLYAMAALAALAGILLLRPGGSAAESGPNAQFHEGLAKSEYTKVVAGSPQVVTLIGLSDADLNRALDQKVKNQLAQGSVADAEQSLAPAPGVKPSLSPEMAADLKTGKTQIRTVFLFDSVAEDGDIVELLINGSPFVQVPLTHAGMLINLPLAADGSSAVTLRAVQDGQGGITVGCRTSQGDFFTSVLQQGQTIMLRFAM